MNTKQFSLIALLLILTGCNNITNDEAKIELNDLGLKFNEVQFLKAIEYNNERAVTLFLILGINPNINDEFGSSALDIASIDFNEKIIKNLIQHGAKVQGNLGGETLLSACWHNNLNIVKILIQKKTNINFKGFEQITPLMNACIKGNQKLIAFLVKHGASINSREKDGFSPLLYACIHNSINAIAYLLRNGADVNQRNKNDVSPLKISILNNNLPLVKLLINNGADLSIKDKQGESALSLAIKLGHSDIKSFIKSKK
jgi:ankyrin repeat protein